jgi:DNA invertase Pin-like site-specific DNA recombinase
MFRMVHEASTEGAGSEASIMRAVGYTRVSTEEQGLSRAGLDAQRSAIEREIEHRGWELVELYTDVGSGKSTNGRHELAAARGRLSRSEADVLVVAKLDRLSRSVVDFGDMLEDARKEGWALVALDLGVDTSTSVGELVANVMMSVAQWERRAIGERTKAAMRAKRAQGVWLSRPSTLPAEVRARIRDERDEAATYAAIAERLNAEGVPTARGGRSWYPSSVRAVDQAARGGDPPVAGAGLGRGPARRPPAKAV